MTIHNIRIFVTLYQLRNVSLTAKTLGLLQPAVSRAVREIEKEYKVQLFSKISQRLVPTYMADRIYVSALQTLSSYENFEYEMKDENQRPIRVGATSTIGTRMLPHVIEEFKKDYGNIPIYVKVENGSRLLDFLESDEVDFALIESFIDGKNLIMEELYTDRLIPVFSPQNELRNLDHISIAELSRCPLLLKEKGSVTRTMIDQIFVSHEITVDPIMESGSVHALLSFAVNNQGVALIPEGIARYYIDNGLVMTTEISDETFSRKNHVVTHKGKILSPACEEFISRCKAYAKDCVEGFT